MSLEQTQVRSSTAEPWADAARSPLISWQFPWGLNENLDQDLGEASAGYNFELAYGQTSFVPRAPFDLAGTAPNGGTITSLMQLVTRANAQSTLVAAGATVYEWDGGSGWTSKGTVAAPALLRDAYWALTDISIITDISLNNPVKQWDGTTFSTLTTGLGSALYAKYAIVFLNRVWLFNIKSGSSTFPHMILACAFENPNLFDPTTRGGPTTVGGGTFSTGLEAFYLFVPDLKPINGVCLFANQLIISTDTGRMWNLQGTDSETFQFVDFYDNSPSVGQENVVTIGNDVVFARQGGAIALISATQNYGNVFTGNLSSWIPMSTANLNGFSQIVYDVLNQKVLFFTNVGKVLVLYKNLLAQDRFQVLGGKSPWSVYTTLDASDFVTQAARFMQIPGTTNYSVFWGDNTGRVFNMYGTGTNGDAGSSVIQALRTSRHIGDDILNPWPWTQENIGGHIKYRRNQQTSLTLSLVWDEEYSQTQQTVTLQGQSGANSAAYFGGNFYYNGTSYYNQGFQFANYRSSINVDPGGKGPGFTATVSASSLAPFEVTSIDFE